MLPPTLEENSYQKILGVVGVAMFWTSLSSFLHERYGSFELPIDPLKGLKDRGDIVIWGMLVSWPLFILVNLIGWRLAIYTKAYSRWDRLPMPFNPGKQMMSIDRKAYSLIFAVIFYLWPYVHILQFGLRFFFYEPTTKPIFVWNKDAWLIGLHNYYEGAFYYGWAPFLILLFLVGVFISSYKLAKAVFA